MCENAQLKGFLCLRGAIQKLNIRPKSVDQQNGQPFGFCQCRWHEVVMRSPTMSHACKKTRNIFAYQSLPSRSFWFMLVTKRYAFNHTTGKRALRSIPSIQFPIYKHSSFCKHTLHNYCCKVSDWLGQCVLSDHNALVRELNT